MMLGAAIVAAVGVTLPAEASDRDGDGFPETVESAVEKKIYSLAGSLAAVRGGEWAVKSGHDYVMISKKIL